MKKINWVGAAFLGLAVLWTACSQGGGSGQPSDGEVRTGKLKVVTTTTMITDLVKQVGGDLVEVEGLMEPGVDPHQYDPTAGAVTKMRAADLIFYNGLMLEGKMDDRLVEMARDKTKLVYAITEKIDRKKLLEPEEFEGHYDPHVWFDPTLWVLCVDLVVEGLGAADAANKAKYEANGEALKEEILEIHEWAKSRVAQVPEGSRVLVTSHDAFNYFAGAYDFEVVALLGISTEDEASAANVTRLVDLIKSKNIKAIFSETSVSSKGIDQIRKDAGVENGGELFSDAMGKPGEMEGPEGAQYDVGTYQGMIKHNINTVVEALK